MLCLLGRLKCDKIKEENPAYSLRFDIAYWYFNGLLYELKIMLTLFPFSDNYCVTILTLSSRHVMSMFH